MTHPSDRLAPDERCTHIEAAIATYPDLSEEQLDDVLFWLKHEATALEVGLVASNPRLAKQYRRLRADHLDRLTRRDAAQAAAVVGAVAALAGGIVYLAL
ncbi:MAG: hypothetical protein ABW203_02130 [Novosphingobium sp.]